MNKLIVVFLVIVFVAIAQAKNKEDASQLNRALDRAIAQVIRAGTWEAIMNRHLGAGNYEIPTRKRFGPDCGRDYYPEIFTKYGDYSLSEVVSSGQLVFAGRENGVFARSNGKFIVAGVEYFLAAAIASELSDAYNTAISATIYDVGFSSDVFGDLALTAINGQMYDAVIGGLTFVGSRGEEIGFTCGYFATNQDFIRTGLQPTRLITGRNEIDQSDVRVGVIAGSTGYTWAHDNLEHADIVTISSASRFRSAVVSGFVHVAIADDWELDEIINTGRCSQCRKLGYSLQDGLYVAYVPYYLH